MAAYAPSALQRVARESNGWFPVGVPLKVVPEMFSGIQGMAKEAGRDPSKLELLVRGNCEFSDSALGDDRADFTGTIDQIGADIATTKEIGAHELVLDVQFAPGVEATDDYLNRLQQLWDVAKK